MKPRPGKTFHTRYYRYTRRQLRLYPDRCGHPMMLVAAMGNKSVRAIVRHHLGNEWTNLFMDLCHKGGRFTQSPEMMLALDGAAGELKRRTAWFRKQ